MNAAAERPHVVKDARGKRPTFQDAPGQDQAMAMIMVLANEVAVLHDRLDSVERYARTTGLDLAAGVEALVLDQDALEAREAWRQDFLERLFYLMRKDAREAAEADTKERFHRTITEIAEA
ncbi:hypothetical protein [Niveispirillum sp. KHB5.9]|uniref:hypothetical protein n=1 Tax=Niveispirillum sp. KHB5.9 TaxID=3400269 RepID=UPI003A863E3A